MGGQVVSRRVWVAGCGSLSRYSLYTRARVCGQLSKPATSCHPSLLRPAGAFCVNRPAPLHLGAEKRAQRA